MDRAQAILLAVLASCSGIIGAAISWRKDQREERAEPITQSTAILTQQREVAISAMDMARQAQESAKKSNVAALAAMKEAETARLEAMGAREESRLAQIESHEAKQEVQRMSERWGSWYRDLVDRWSEHRARETPPVPPH